MGCEAPSVSRARSRSLSTPISSALPVERRPIIPAPSLERFMPEGLGRQSPRTSAPEHYQSCGCTGSGTAPAARLRVFGRRNADGRSRRPVRTHLRSLSMRGDSLELTRWFSAFAATSSRQIIRRRAAPKLAPGAQARLKRTAMLAVSGALHVDQGARYPPCKRPDKLQDAIGGLRDRSCRASR